MLHNAGIAYYGKSRTYSFGKEHIRIPHMKNILLGIFFKKLSGQAKHLSRERINDVENRPENTFQNSD